jgi:hypothetical protein
MVTGESGKKEPMLLAKLPDFRPNRWPTTNG